MSVASEQQGREVSEADPLLPNASHSDRNSPRVHPAYPHLDQRRILRSLTSTTYREARSAVLLQNANALLLLLPIGLVGGYLQWNAVAVLIINILAIIPLSAFVSSSSDKLSSYFGELAGGLINATFGNTVELIVGILALSHGQIRFAQSVMLGSILSDILLVLGFCLFTAAYKKQELLKFNKVVADALSSLMIITAIALILPTALYSTFTTVSEIQDKILAFSRATAVLLLLTYGFYIYFQLGSHKQIFEAAEQEANEGEQIEGEQIEAENDAAGPQNAARDIFRPSAVLVVSALAIMACAHYVIDSVEGTAKLTGMAQSFIAAILVPIASNAPECAAVLAAARKQHINYALGVIVSSILQIGLFVLPILVVIGWCFDKPMTLYFQTSQTFLLFFAVLVVNHLLQEGQYTYIHGAMLVALYAIVGMVIYVGQDDTSGTYG